MFMGLELRRKIQAKKKRTMTGFWGTTRESGPENNVCHGSLGKRVFSGQNGPWHQKL